MPQFPRYESQGQLTTQTPSVMAQPSTEAQQTEQGAKAGQAISESALKWNEYVTKAKKNISLANAKTDIATHESNAALEQDPNKQSYYLDQLKQSQDRNTQGLSPEARNEVALEYKLSAIKLGGIFKKKEIQVNNVATQVRIDNVIKNPTGHSMQEIGQIIKDNPGLNPKQIYAIQKKANADLGVNRISKDLYSSQSPEDISAVKDAINAGHYEQGGVTIDPFKKLQLFNRATKMETYLKNQRRDKIENDMARREIDNDLTLDEVRDAFKNDLVSRSFYESRKKTLDSTSSDTAATDPKTYNQLTSLLVDPNTDPTEARNAILQANADGKLSRQELTSLYQEHLIPSQSERINLQQALGEQGKTEFDKIKAMNDSEEKRAKDKSNWWHSAFQMIDNTLGKDAEAVADARQKLYGKASLEKLKAEDMPKAAREVLSAAFLKSHPEVKNYPKEGKVIGQYRYFPDGTAEEEPAK